MTLWNFVAYGLFIEYSDVYGLEYIDSPKITIVLYHSSLIHRACDILIIFQFRIVIAVSYGTGRLWYNPEHISSTHI